MDMQNVPTPEAKMPEAIMPEMTQESPKPKLGLFALIGVILVTAIAGGVYYFGFTKDVPPTLPSQAGLQGKIFDVGKTGFRKYDKDEEKSFKKPGSHSKLVSFTTNADRNTIAYSDGVVSLQDVVEKNVVPVEGQSIASTIYDAQTKLFHITENTVENWKNATKIDLTYKSQQGLWGFIITDKSKFDAYDLHLQSEEPTFKTDLMSVAHAGWNPLVLDKATLKELKDDPNVLQIWGLNDKSEFDKPLDLATLDVNTIKNFVFWVELKDEPSAKTKAAVTQEQKQRDTGIVTTVDDKLSVTHTAGSDYVQFIPTFDKGTHKVKGLEVSYVMKGEHSLKIATLTPKTEGGYVKDTANQDVTCVQKVASSDDNGNVIMADVCSVAKLTQDKEYSFTVTVIYDDGTAESKTPAVFTETPKVAEEKAAGETVVSDGLHLKAVAGDKQVVITPNVTTDDTKFDGISIAWDDGTGKGTVNLKYTPTNSVVDYTSGLPNVVSWNKNDKTITVSGLTNDKEYTFQVTLLYKTGYKSTVGTKEVTATPKAASEPVAAKAEDLLGVTADTTLPVSADAQAGTELAYSDFNLQNTSDKTLLITQITFQTRQEDCKIISKMKFGSSEVTCIDKGLLKVNPVSKQPGIMDIEAGKISNIETKITINDTATVGTPAYISITAVKFTVEGSDGVYMLSPVKEARGKSLTVTAKPVVQDVVVEDNLQVQAVWGNTTAEFTITPNIPAQYQNQFKEYKLSFGLDGSEAPINAQTKDVTIKDNKITIANLTNDKEYTLQAEIIYNDGYISKSSSQGVTGKPTEPLNVTAKLSTNNPASSHVEQGANGVPFLTLELTTNKDIKVNTITLLKGESGALSGLGYISVDLDGETAHGKFGSNNTLNLSFTTPVKILQDSPATLKVAADIAYNAKIGDQHSIILRGITTDIKKLGYELVGNTMTVIAAQQVVQPTKNQNITSLELEYAPDPAIQSVAYEGDKDIKFMEANLVTSSKVSLTKIVVMPRQSLKPNPTKSSHEDFSKIYAKIKIGNGERDSEIVQNPADESIELKFKDPIDIDTDAKISIYADIGPDILPPTDIHSDFFTIRALHFADNTLFNQDPDLDGPVIRVLDISKKPVASANYGYTSLFDSLLDDLFNLFK